MPLTLKSSEINEDSVEHIYDCNKVVITKGDGMYGCEAGRQVQVNSIKVSISHFEECDLHSIYVYHDSKSDIYTDTGFEEAISDILKLEVNFTESGMQEDGIASMEAIIDIE